MPISTGRPSATSSSSRREQLEVVLDRLAEADPGVEHDPLLGDAVADREAEPLLEERLDLGDDVVVARVALHRARVAEHVHQAAARRRPRRPRSAISGSPRSAVTSLTIVAPAAERGRGDGGLRGVDRDPRLGARRRPAPRSPAAPGAAPRPRDTGSAPGRVDSPPMSRIAAPSARAAAPWAIAASGSRYSPPSENESGVTLTTPMTVKRRGRHSSGHRPCRSKYSPRLLLPLAVAVALDAHPVHPVDHPHDQRDDQQRDPGRCGGAVPRRARRRSAPRRERDQQRQPTQRAMTSRARRHRTDDLARSSHRCGQHHPVTASAPR